MDSFDTKVFLDCFALDVGLPPENLGGPLTSDMKFYDAACSWFFSKVFEKFMPSGEMSAAAKAAGLEKFLYFNNRSLTYQEPPRDELIEVIIGEFREELYRFFMPRGASLFDLESISLRLNVGPGASLGSNSYNFYTKLFDSDLTATHPHLFALYRSAIARDPAWSTAESYRQRRYGMRLVDGSRLFHVPKETSVTRTATTEPSINMLFQKALAALIEDRLRSYFRIDIRSQPERNKRMARRGSRWGTFGTIDGKSASDCINIQQLDHLPGVIAGWIKLVRAERVVLPDGTLVGLGMAGTMGQGFTFAFQTAYFACLTRACYRVMGITPRPSNLGVFGDDIVVRRDAFQLVIRALKHVGQVPNDHKSFNTGSFRESCGGDYFKGLDIRPPQIKSLSNDAEVYAAINRLNIFAAKLGVPLRRTVSYLRGFLRGKVLFVPPWFGEDEGIHIGGETALRLGYKPNRQGSYSIQFWARVPYSFRISDPDVAGNMQFLHYTVYKGVVRIKKLEGLSKGRLKAPVGYNPWGLMTSFLGGFIRDGQIGLGGNTLRPRWKVSRLRSRFWDHPVGADRFGRDHIWQFVVEETF